MFRRRNRRRFVVSHPREAKPATIVHDAAIATVAVSDGKLIPVVIISTSERPDVAELLRVHEETPPGDVQCQWGSPAEGKVVLVLEFVRPAQVFLMLEFDIVKQGGVVDQILGARALYLQAGYEGDRLVTTMHYPRILIEVPDTGFDLIWQDMLYRQLVHDYRQNGLSRPQAKLAARDFIKEWRQFTREFRVRGGPAESNPT